MIFSDSVQQTTHAERYINKLQIHTCTGELRNKNYCSHKNTSCQIYDELMKIRLSLSNWHIFCFLTRLTLLHSLEWGRLPIKTTYIKFYLMLIFLYILQPLVVVMVSTVDAQESIFLLQYPLHQLRHFKSTQSYSAIRRVWVNFSSQWWDKYGCW